MLVGQQIGPFEIEKELGSGAMGTVYKAKYQKAEDKLLPVALKVVALGLLGNEGAMARFDREANILKQLRHRHIVRLLATGHYRKAPFIAMEYIDGEALDRVLARRGRISWEEVVAHGKQLCAALQYAHEKGIIHRDLKPSNLMIAKDGTLKLTDFGIAKDTDVTALTGANSTIGTAAYMSPEQCKGDRNLTQKSDLYSLGVVFFELLTGRKPFTADSTVEMFLKHVNERPPRPGKLVPDLPTKFEGLILQLMEKDKDHRPADAAWVTRILTEVEEDAFTRKSAGLDAANARRVDRPRDEDRSIEDADREAARALQGKKKRRGKRKAGGAWYEKKWLQAAAIVLLLAGMAMGVYVALKPPSAEKLFAEVAAVQDRVKNGDKVSHEAKIQAAERYLKAYGDTPGDQTEAAAALYREGRVQEREIQLANRFARGLTKPDESDDPEAYKEAWQAMEAEKVGRLKDAANWWGQVKARFPDAAGAKFTLKDADLVKARWVWVADKRLADLQRVAAEEQMLRRFVEDNQRFEVPMPYDGTSPRSVAARAIRLEHSFQDKEKAARTWDALIKLTEKEADQRVWYLLACQKRAAIQGTSTDGAAAQRATRIAKHLAEAEALANRVKDDPEKLVEWADVRGMCREVIELYDDDGGEMPNLVAKAKQIMATVPKTT